MPITTSEELLIEKVFQREHFVHLVSDVLSDFYFYTIVCSVLLT